MDGLLQNFLCRKLICLPPAVEQTRLLTMWGQGTMNVAVGSKTEVAALQRDVCFAPVSGHRQGVSACPKSAKGLNRSRGRTLWLATQRSNRRHVILTRGAISLLRAMIRWTC